MATLSMGAQLAHRRMQDIDVPTAYKIRRLPNWDRKAETKGDDDDDEDDDEEDEDEEDVAYCVLPWLLTYN